MRCYTPIKRMLMYMAVFVSALLIAGCSQGPVTNEEAEELRSEIKDMSDQLDQVRGDLATVLQAVQDEVEDRDMEQQVEDMRDRLGSMLSRLSDLEEALKPEEPETPPGQAPAGGMGGAGGAGGTPGGGGFQ
ncbi:MAG: hypothetical protein ACQET7_14630 [Thermodesulfobacteriota bacterium]